MSYGKHDAEKVLGHTIRVHLESDILLRLWQCPIVPRQEVVDGTLVPGVADAIAEYKRGRAVAEERHAYSELLVPGQHVEL